MNDGNYTYDFENEKYLDNQQYIWNLMNQHCAEFLGGYAMNATEDGEFMTEVKDTFDAILERLDIDIAIDDSESED